jgi:malate dehydrogenase (oxaloacetate-decarboxylating)(NADP+)
MTIVLTPYWSNGVQKLKVTDGGGMWSLQRSWPLGTVTPRLLTTFAGPKKPAHGLTPPILEDQVHAVRCLTQFRSKDKNIEKYIYLSALKQQDTNMFYRLCLQNMSEFTPIIYTPTVGDACLQFSHIYRRPEGLVSVTSNDVKYLFTILFLVHLCQGYGQNSVSPEKLAQDRRCQNQCRYRWWVPNNRLLLIPSNMISGSRILGLGDLGVNGMPISIGKLSLYIAGAG